jgi:hypothetical protein
MSRKIWWCSNCGYEVSNRGTCQRCDKRLIASPFESLTLGQARNSSMSYQTSGPTPDVRC